MTTVPAERPMSTPTGEKEVFELTGSQILLELLQRQGVDTIFGYPGGAIMPIYDALYDYQDTLRHVLVRHEQGAVHAAEGYARITGRAGVCMATSGPGATNLVTGIADAMLDSVPLVCITGQVSLALLGTDAFQDLSSLRQAATLINQAERPLMLIGHGVLISEAADEVRALSERAGIPVASTLLGLSAFPTDHPLYAGMLGMHGNYGPNKLTNRADVIIAVGMRFDDRVTGKLATYARQAKIVHIDIDRAEHNKNVPVSVAIVSDAKQALRALLPLVQTKSHSEWLCEFRRCEEIEFEKVIG